MNLSGIRQGELREVFDALEQAFSVVGIDFYLIGALARDVWYSKEDKVFRTTKDVDFAVLVGSQKEYEDLKAHLIAQNKFHNIRENSFVMLTPLGVQVDILPFGEIEIDDGTKLEGIGLANIKVNGFMEVYQSGTEQVQIETGHHFKIATLPAIALLKFIAFDDRPEHRLKDARDIANIFMHFFDLQTELIYEQHSDLFGGEDLSLEEIAAIVIGREIRKIIGHNENLLIRFQGIITGLLEKQENSAFIRNVVSEAGSTVVHALSLLKKLLTGLNNL
jgi:predicted nucleotidyltransferase